MQGRLEQKAARWSRLISTLSFLWHPMSLEAVWFSMESSEHQRKSLRPRRQSLDPFLWLTFRLVAFTAYWLNLRLYSLILLATGANQEM